MGVFKDMEKLMQMKAAMAMEKAAAAEGGAASGMAAGLGLMLPAMFAQYFSGPQAAARSAGTGPTAACPECRSGIPADSKFCPQCGHQLVIFTQCSRCGKNLAPTSRFCSRCGLEATAGPQKRLCKGCGSENLPDSMYCNACGEKL
jgi:predicted amidophosphoribosyltransferase